MRPRPRLRTRANGADLVVGLFDERVPFEYLDKRPCRTASGLALPSRLSFELA